MARRTGVTLVEVLVAIFVMGIGMIALLTLFPIGVLRMAQAINDERTAQAAYNAHKYSIISDIRNDPLVVSNGTIPNLFAQPLAALPRADPYGESYTIFVDPIGGQSGATSPWVGGVTGLLLRRPVSFANNAAAVNSMFTLWDDMTYYNDPTQGLPGTPELAGSFVLRNSRFSWGYTLRRPMTAQKSVVECAIVVFDSRSLSLNANLGLGEWVYGPLNPGTQAFFNPGNNTIIVAYNPANYSPPQVRPGGWIMDATQTQVTSGGVTYGSQHNYWYRVLASQDVIGGGGIDYTVFEIQGQIRGFNNFPGPTGVPATPAYPGNATSTDPTTSLPAFPGTIVILDGVAEVFERGPARTTP